MLSIIIHTLNIQEKTREIIDLNQDKIIPYVHVKICCIQSFLPNNLESFFENLSKKKINSLSLEFDQYGHQSSVINELSTKFSKVLRYFINASSLTSFTLTTQYLEVFDLTYLSKMPKLTSVSFATSTYFEPNEYYSRMNMLLESIPNNNKLTTFILPKIMHNHQIFLEKLKHTLEKSTFLHIIYPDNKGNDILPFNNINEINQLLEKNKYFFKSRSLNNTIEAVNKAKTTLSLLEKAELLTEGRIADSNLPNFIEQQKETIKKALDFAQALYKASTTLTAKDLVELEQLFRSCGTAEYSLPLLKLTAEKDENVFVTMLKNFIISAIWDFKVIESNASQSSTTEVTGFSVVTVSDTYQSSDNSKDHLEQKSKPTVIKLLLQFAEPIQNALKKAKSHNSKENQDASLVLSEISELDTFFDRTIHDYIGKPSVYVSSAEDPAFELSKGTTTLIFRTLDMLRTANQVIAKPEEKQQPKSPRPSLKIAS